MAYAIERSIAKIEGRMDMYLPACGSYVEAAGEELDMTVKLTDCRAQRPYRIGDVAVVATLSLRRTCAAAVRRHHG